MSSYRPLAGVRVLSFEVAASLPAGTRTLADLGADVLRVAEPAGQVNPYIRIFDSSLINKRSVIIDLRQAAGRELATDLAMAADVVCNNFRPHVLPQFGLSPDALIGKNPRLIVLQLTGYGAPGPWASFPAYGPSVEAAGGLNSLMGAPDVSPQRVGGGVFADTLGGRYAALAICDALVRRQQSGRGGLIDASMYEAIVTGIGDMVVEASQTGRAPQRNGNRSERHAPQGIYPALGDDEWVAITVDGSDAWRALTRVLGEPSLESGTLATLSARRAEHDRIDEAISRWTSQRTKSAAAEELQAAGIAAGPVQRTRDVPLDPQYVANGFFQQIAHAEPILGFHGHPHMRLPARFSGFDRTSLTDHQIEGAGGRAAVAEWLGLDAAGLEQLIRDGAMGEPRPMFPAGTEPPGWFGARQAHRDGDFGERLDLPVAAYS